MPPAKGAFLFAGPYGRVVLMDDLYGLGAGQNRIGEEQNGYFSVKMNDFNRNDEKRGAITVYGIV